ncbi:hypothetical protein CFOL_v3_03889, partial [Cephalotus follicularis]
CQKRTCCGFIFAKSVSDLPAPFSPVFSFKLHKVLSLLLHIGLLTQQLLQRNLASLPLLGSVLIMTHLLRIQICICIGHSMMMMIMRMMMMMRITMIRAFMMMIRCDLCQTLFRY